MASLPDSQSRLEHLIRYGNDPAGIALQNYLDTGDITYIDGMSSGCANWGLRYLMQVVVQEELTTPVSRAVYEAVVHRIVNGEPTQADDFPGMLAVACVEKDKSGLSKEQALIDMLRKIGVDDNALALFWVCNKSARGENIIAYARGELKKIDLKLFADSFQLPEETTTHNGFEEILLGLSDEQMLALFKAHQSMPLNKDLKRRSIGWLQAIVARDRPQLFREFLQWLSGSALAKGVIDWRYVVGATHEFDAECIQACLEQQELDALIVLDRLRAGQHVELALEQCRVPAGHRGFYQLLYLAEQAPAMLVEKLTECVLDDNIFAIRGGISVEHCLTAAEHWHEGGERVFSCFMAADLFDISAGHNKPRVEALLNAALHVAATNEQAQQWIRDLLTHYSDLGQWQQMQVWGRVARRFPTLIEADLWQFLQHKKKTIRSFSVNNLQHESISDPAGKAIERLDYKSADARLGAVELLGALGSDMAIIALKNAMEQNHPAKVRQAIIKTLEKLGHVLSLESASDDQTLANILTGIESRKNSLKLPKTADWLDLTVLPALPNKEGKPLPEYAIISLFSVQSKHKTINPAPDNIGLLSHVDRGRSGDFAISLLRQWLASSRQDTADRWVLTLAGLLGDQRVLPALSDPIKAWAEGRRHKLAEYAAMAIALVPRDEALMILDSLANRYRSRFRNIGKACRTALEQAAQTQGVTMDELADMIVPSLDFDENYERPLPDTDILAVLQPDFKLTFLNPSNESETKSPPSSLPATAVEDIKVLRKMIRETVKGQTMRLEQALVGERSWTSKRWQELFEINPFLQSYASRLVWASLDANNQVHRLFRRYPNGLLANASGEMVELDESDHAIVIAHPLTIDGQSLQDWKDHLERMKIKQPFAQLARPVVRLESGYGNRKTLSTTEQHKMASGTFRSRAEKQGWARGSVVDGGGISAYYKHYAGASVSVFLMLEDIWVAQEPGDIITLLNAMFVKSGSVKVGGYLYDEPVNTDDPRVLAFADVPAVVYSETVADLQGFIA